MTSRPAGIPLRPDYGAVASNKPLSISRALAAIVLGAICKEQAITICARSWPDDHLAGVLVRSAVSPTTTADAPTAARWLFISGLAPQAAAIRLFERATRVDLTGSHLLVVPSPSTVPEPAFVAEGSAFPMKDGVFTDTSVGPVRKLMLGCAVTHELEFAVPETASTIIGRFLSEQAGKNLDAAVFSTTAADSVRPAGLLAGVSPIAASGASGIAAMTEDVRNIAAAIAAAGGDADRVVFFAAPAQAITLKLLAGPQFDYQIIGTRALADGTIVGIDPVQIVTGYSGEPEIDVFQEATAHFESTTPLAIGTVGTPPTVAAPVRNAFQSDLLMLRVRLQCCWGPLRPGAVQFIGEVSW